MLNSNGRTSRWRDGAGRKSIRPGEAGGKDGIRHAVDNLLVSGTDSGEHSAEVGAGGVSFAEHKIVGTKADAAFHGDEVVAREIEPFGLDERRFVVALENGG